MLSRAALLISVILAAPAFAQEDGGSSLMIEEWSAPPETVADAGTTLQVESFSVPQSEPVIESIGDAEPPLTTARLYGSLRSQAGIDTSFDSPRGDPLAENVFDLRNRAVLGIDASLSANLRVVAEAHAFWRVTTERAFDRSKGTLDVEAGEAFLDVYTKSVDLRIGNQVVAFGSNIAFAPADQLNPRDQRGSFILGEADDVKLPNLGVRALGTTGRVNWTAVYFPFFEPNRYSVTGQDEAFLQPALGIDLTGDVDESIEDELQPHLLETERPKGFPWLGDLGLRATTEAGPVKLGASWVWVNEKLPMVTMDPELAAFVGATARGNEPSKAVAASLQDRLLAGEQLFEGSYPRQHVFSLEAQTLIGSAQLDFDFAYSPEQTLYSSDLSPIRKAVLTWVLGVSQAEDSPLLYNVTYLGLSVPDLASDDYLFLLEPATAAGAPRTMMFHALFAAVGYTFLDDRLEVSVRGAVEPIQRSWALAPQVAWKGIDRITLAIGAEYYEGKVYSPFGYFDRNDQVVARFGMDLF